MSFEQDIQKLDADGLVTLFEIDLSPLGSATIYRFCPSNTGSGSVYFDGNEYSNMPIAADGFERNGNGPAPKPKLRVSNVTRYLHSALDLHNDLLGARVTRIVTMAEYLDGGNNENNVGFFPKDIFVIDRKAVHNNVYIEWELASNLDQSGTKLPQRMALRNICTHRYRSIGANGGFSYINATCPYTGNTCYNGDNETTTAANDKCAKTLAACKLRFGDDAELPARFFPAVNRSRY
jgi:lambda family phage minor tail protein L